VLARGFSEVHELTEQVLDAMQEYMVVAPAHNGPYIEVIRCFEKITPSAKLIGTFETGFHSTIPLERRLYGVPYEWFEEFGLERKGYHGASHRYISNTIAKRYQTTGRLISCHLGGSGSVCAVVDGKSVDSSFGLSLQTGLIHANRTGDADPFLVPFLLRKGMSLDEILEGINKRGGLLGISGVSNDLRDIEQAADEGNERAQLAIDVYCTHLVRFIGSFYAELGGLDHLAFTGGIGENSDRIRAEVCRRLKHLGIDLDENANKNCEGDSVISTSASAVMVHRIATDEEAVVSSQAYEYLNAY